MSIYLEYNSGLGTGLFHAERIVALFEKLNIVSQWEKLTVNDENIPGRFIDYIRDFKLLDSIIICTCYENYFKSLCLRQGYFVHRIKALKTDTGLSISANEVNAEIEKGPVSLQSIFGERASDEKLIEQYVPDTANTLSLTIFMKDTYQEFFQLPKEITAFLKNEIEYRNQLHLNLSHINGYLVWDYYGEWEQKLKQSDKLFQANYEAAKEILSFNTEIRR